MFSILTRTRRRWPVTCARAGRPRVPRNAKFHDGSAFNADAVVFTWESIKKKDAPHFDTYGSAQVSARLAGLKALRKLDDHTVEIETDKPTSFVPYQVCYMLIVSPTQCRP